MRFGEDAVDAVPAPVSGKPQKRWKRGPPELRPGAALAHLAAAGGGTPFVVRACLRGALLEANDRLLREPHALRCAPAGAGYVAVLKPHNPGALAELRSKTLSQEAYVAALARRASGAAAAAATDATPAAD